MALHALLTAVALVGHFALIVWLYNRLHTQAWAPRTIKLLERLILALGALLAAILVVADPPWSNYFLSVFDRLPAVTASSAQIVAAGYRPVTYVAALASVPYWLIPKWRQRPAQALLSNDTHQIDVVQVLGWLPARGLVRQWMCRLPGNQIFQVAVQRKNLQISCLPLELDGLTIAHLSDLHLTGQFDRHYYELLVEHTMVAQPDLIVLTGDILEKERCLSWVQPIFGQLRAPLGCYFVLGNHELRLPEVNRLREALVSAGWTDLGGRSATFQHRGHTLLIEGCEWPWHGVRPPWMSRVWQTSPINAPGKTCSPALKILLTHTPDVWLDARRAGFDLVLAGHNHGGQICLPLIGPLIVPSRFGFRYASGVYEQRPTLLHVSRGLGSTHSVRFRCPPELAILVLRSARGERPGH
jgi:predicted MPP superfamily phosphohydrolase